MISISADNEFSRSVANCSCCCCDTTGTLNMCFSANWFYKEITYQLEYLMEVITSPSNHFECWKVFYSFRVPERKHFHLAWAVSLSFESIYTSLRVLG